MKSFIPHAALAALFSHSAFQVAKTWSQKVPEDLDFFENFMWETKVRFTFIFILSYSISLISNLLGYSKMSLVLVLSTILLAIIAELILVYKIAVKNQDEIMRHNKRSSDRLFKKSIPGLHLSYSQKVIVSFIAAFFVIISLSQVADGLKKFNFKLRPENIKVEVQIEFK